MGIRLKSRSGEIKPVSPILDGYYLNTYLRSFHSDLHAVWDGSLITKATSTIPKNYTLPLPYPEIEQALRGSSYDPYIRRIIWEGIFQKWADEIPGWLSCPDAVKPTSADSQLALGLGGTTGIEILPDNDVLCPYHWAIPTHDLLCDGVWPKEVDEPPYKRTVRISPFFRILSLTLLTTRTTTHTHRYWNLTLRPIPA